MSLVLDASLTMTWYFEDEATPTTDIILESVSENGAIVPPIWRLEIANAFQSAIRRNRISNGYRDESLSDLARLPITIDPEADAHVWTTALRLAERFALTIYDATYLELAQRRRLPLATLDSDLRRAAASLDIAVLGREGS